MISKRPLWELCASERHFTQKTRLSLTVTEKWGFGPLKQLLVKQVSFRQCRSNSLNLPNSDSNGAHGSFTAEGNDFPSSYQPKPVTHSPEVVSNDILPSLDDPLTVPYSLSSHHEFLKRNGPGDRSSLLSKVRKVRRPTPEVEESLLELVNLPNGIFAKQNVEFSGTSVDVSASEFSFVSFCHSTEGKTVHFFLPFFLYHLHFMVSFQNVRNVTKEGEVMPLI